MEAVNPIEGKFLSEGAKKEQIKRQKKAEWNKVKGHVLTVAALAAADGVLIYMVMSGKIDLLYGVMFVAIVSAIGGYQAK